MKKLILSAAIILGSLSAFAQTPNTPPSSSPASSTEQATTNQTTEQTAQTADVKYTEIKTEEVPTVVTTALKKAYPTAIVDKVYINDKKEYKLEIKVGDKVGALYADATGNWIKK